MIYSVHLLRHLRQNIGKNIYKLRLQKKITLQKLAKLTNIPEKYLDHYEIGKNEINLQELLKIACIFDVEVTSLLV